MAIVQLDNVIDENRQTEAMRVQAEEVALYENAAVQHVMPIGRDLKDIFSKGQELSVEHANFSSVLEKSIDHEIVGPVIEEIKAKRKKLKIKHVIVYFIGFAVFGLIAHVFFPRPPQPKVVDDAWSELNVNSKHYETEQSLIDSVGKRGQSSMESIEKMSVEKRICFLKYRTKNIGKSYSDYMKGYKVYIDNLDEWVSNYEDLELKVCYVEGVLKSFPLGGDEIGLMSYATKIREDGDGLYADREQQLEKAIACCDDILGSLRDDKVKKRKCAQLQKAQLWMYRWLVENVKKHQGKKVEYILDDKADPGVNFREKAIQMIEQDKELQNVGKCKVLWNQCIDILLQNEDKNWFKAKTNRIYFNRETYYRKGSLVSQKDKWWKK